MHQQVDIIQKENRTWLKLQCEIHPEFIPKWQICDEFWVFERECNLSNLDLHNFGEFERIVNVPKLLRSKPCNLCHKKNRCSLVKGGHSKERIENMINLFDASGVRPPNNLLLENVECEGPYHFYTSSMNQAFYISLSYLMKYHRPYHLFSPNNSWFSCVFFSKKHPKNTTFLRWCPIFCRILPLKTLHHSLLFLPAKPRPRKTSKAHASARASKPRAFTSSTTHWV